MNNKTLLEEIKKLNLEQLANFCTEISKIYGYSSIKDFLESTSTQGGKASDDAEEEKPKSKICDLVLVEFDKAQRTSVIRKIKDEIKDCTSMKAKELSEQLPLTIFYGVLQADADEIIKQWLKIGAKLIKK
jgi:ribosomal protein L7/L12